MRPGRAAGVTLGLLALALGFLAQTVGLSPAGRRVALPVAIVVSVLLAVQLRRDARGQGAVGLDGSPHDAEASPTSPWASLAWVLALPALIAFAGLCEGVGLHAFAFLRRRGRESWPVAALGAIAIAGLVWWVVGTLLAAEIPGGLVRALITG